MPPPRLLIQILGKRSQEEWAGGTGRGWQWRVWEIPHLSPITFHIPTLCYPTGPHSDQTLMAQLTQDRNDRTCPARKPAKSHPTSCIYPKREPPMSCFPTPLLMPNVWGFSHTHQWTLHLSRGQLGVLPSDSILSLTTWVSTDPIV